MVLSWLRLVFLLQHMFHLRREKMNLFEWFISQALPLTMTMAIWRGDKTKEANG